MTPYVLRISPISHRLAESGVRVLFEQFGEVTLVRIAKAADGQFLKINRRPPSEHTMDEHPVTHNFGIAVVTMPDGGGAYMAMRELSGDYIDGSVVEVKILGGGSSSS